MSYKINVKGVVNTFPADTLKHYVESQNVTPCRSAVTDAPHNAKSE